MNPASLPTCKRCRQQQYIPTYQYVKFDDELHYLCDACWERFRYWFHHRTGRTRARGVSAA